MRLVEAGLRRDHPAVEDERELDQTGDPRCHAHVPDVGLDAADRTREGAIAPRSFPAACAIDGGQGTDLEGVTQHGAGAVRLDVPHLRRGETRGSQRGAHGGGLPDDARRHVADLGGAVVGHRRCGDDGIDVPAAGERVREAGQHHDRASVGHHGPARPAVKRAAAPVPRVRAVVGVVVARRLRQGQVDAAGDSHLALPRAERLPGQVHGEQRAGARALHREARAAQVEPVRNTGAQEVLVVGDHHRLAGRQPSMLGAAHDVVEQIGAPTGGAEHADPSPMVCGERRRVLQRAPGALEEQPLLRIGEPGLLRREAEEGGVEGARVGDVGAAGEEGLISCGLLADAGVGQLEVAEPADRGSPLPDQIPELVDAGGAGEPARQPHDGEPWIVHRGRSGRAGGDRAIRRRHRRASRPAAL